MKREALRVTSTIPVAPTTLYFAWIDSDHHSSMTGGAAKLDPTVGAKYSALDGYVGGKLVILDLGRRIVMSWRTNDFPRESPDSRVEVHFETLGPSTRILILHTDIPEGQSEKYKELWNDKYIAPMRSYFSKFLPDPRNPPVRRPPPPPPEGEDEEEPEEEVNTPAKLKARFAERRAAKAAAAKPAPAPATPPKPSAPPAPEKSAAAPSKKSVPPPPAKPSGPGVHKAEKKAPAKVEKKAAAPATKKAAAAAKPEKKKAAVAKPATKKADAKPGAKKKAAPAKKSPPKAKAKKPAAAKKK